MCFLVCGDGICQSEKNEDCDTCEVDCCALDLSVGAISGIAVSTISLCIAVITIPLGVLVCFLWVRVPLINNVN